MKVSDWVICHVLVCVPPRLMEVADTAVTGARARILQDPVLTDLATVETYPYLREEEARDAAADEEELQASVATRIHQKIVSATAHPALSAAPAVVFCLLMVSHEEEIVDVLTDFEAQNRVSKLPVNTVSFIAGDQDGHDGVLAPVDAISLEREIIRSIGQTLERAELDASFRFAPGTAINPRTVEEASHVNRDAGEDTRDRRAIGSRWAGLQSVVTKARSQLSAMKAPSPTKALDQASQQMQNIQLLYVVTVTGAPTGISKAGLKWAESLACHLLERITPVTPADGLSSLWYASFISAGEKIERLIPPIPLESVGKRHVSAKQMGYDFDFLYCAQQVTELIKNDLASLARRGTVVTSVHTVIFSTEQPLADTETISVYRNLCALGQVGWVLGADAKEVSSKFLLENSKVFLDHTDVIEEMVSVMFDSGAIVPVGRHVLSESTE